MRISYGPSARRDDQKINSTHRAIITLLLIEERENKEEGFGVVVDLITRLQYKSQKPLQVVVDLVDRLHPLQASSSTVKLPPHLKPIKLAYGQKYVKGRQFTQTIDADKVAMIDLWEDIVLWSKSSNPERVKFAYMLPNTLPRQYVEVANDAILLEIFRENRR
ncbi:hypothetical protein QJS10_CPA05g01517 [Acorus calamus]|uniref:Uncharacterized protein n=1 Tax=Acorus calamus TaxID=4465 RepID=A0AAV9ETZ6_ACOCL|nr:hypothetical protein QJS10_CPA05g01517 [Acorus calamus]